MKIAIRIIKGDHVPAADYRFLAKHNIALYSKAITLRVEKEKPVKHKQLSEREDASEEAVRFAETLTEETAGELIEA
jgi:hypothetical protein